ncbi:MAG TPA: glycosyltransferase family 39 protein [Terracidiphilus sp.]
MGASWEEAIDASPGRAFAWLTILYFVAVFGLSHLKLMWLDELITLHIAKHGGPAAIWDALAHGADPNPPVTHLLAHYSRALLGDHEWAYRLPAALGYWVGLLSLFGYMRRRVPGTWAIAGTLLSMSMAAFDYSYESRSYGIFYGLAMLAFLSWTCAVDPSGSGRGRTLGVIGLVAGLALGISTNYFAVLAFFPVATGEVVRTAMRARGERRSGGPMRLLRAVDWRIWVAMAVAAMPLLAYRPLIERSIAQFAPYAWNKVSLGQVADSYTEMVEVVLFPLLAFFVLAAGMWLGLRHAEVLCSGCRGRVMPRWMQGLRQHGGMGVRIPTHEVAGILTLMAYPFVGYAVASIRGGMLSPRFVIPVCFGFAIAGTVVAYGMFGHLRRAGMAFGCLMLAWFVSREAYVGYWYEQQKECFYKVVDHLPGALAEVPGSAPIVIPDPLLALTFQHYAPAEMARRVVFPMDFPAIRRYQGDDSPEENLWAGRNLIYTMPIETMAEFQRTTHEYLIVSGDQNWMIRDLNDHHYLLTRLPINTRATDLGGFTPLAHGVPVLYKESWDNPVADISEPLTVPVPFVAAENVPSAGMGHNGGARK